MKIINLKELIKNKTVLIGAVACIIILCAIYALNSLAKEGIRKEETVAYEYTEDEKKLAEEVKSYLAEYLDLTDKTSCEIADMAVQNYNIVMASDTDVIGDEITDAVRSRMKSTMVAFLDQTESLTDENMDALASGITEIIWNNVLEKLSASDLAKTDKYLDEYLNLTESLQEQINALKERKTKISINANIIDNTETEVKGEDLLKGLDSMSDEELRIMAEKLGLSVDQLTEYIEASMSDSNEDLTDDFEKELIKLQKELQKEIQSEVSTVTGKTGAAGKDGKDGKDGQNGKSVYYRYAEDSQGKNWSTYPTESSKYIGIYTGTKASTNPSDYSWSRYTGNDGADGKDGNSVFTVYSEDGIKWYHSDEIPEELDIKWMATYTAVSQKEAVTSSDVEKTKVRYSNEANAKVWLDGNTLIIMPVS